MQIKLLIKKIIPASCRSKIKKMRRRAKNFLKKGNSKITLEDMRKLLVNDFEVSKGDSLIVSSSFGNLNATFSPFELIELLQDIIGNEGNLVMPFYPPGNSYEWAANGQIFDMQTTRSSMGILTQIFSEMPNVYKSMHPTKAVVAWGKNAGEIVSGHENSKTPFYWDSPYGWLLKYSSKSLGLGVMNRPIIHACEDVVLNKSKYMKTKYTLAVKNNQTVFAVETYVHEPNLTVSINRVTQKITELRLLSFRTKKVGFSDIYILDNQELLDKYTKKYN